MPVSASKRLYTQSTSDCINEPIQVATVVVIHPGSLNLRIGRASDTFPVTLPHCLARRKKDLSAPDIASPWMIRPESNHEGCKHQRESGITAGLQALESKTMDSGEARPCSITEELYQFNRRMKGERTDVICPQKFTNTDRKPPHIIGKEALMVEQNKDYNLHWPMRRGHLNVHDGPCGTLTSVLADLELIWGHALQNMLDIPLKDLKHYRALLLIPDVYDHKHVKEMMNLLLDRLGFGAAIVQQESVCAVFGQGVPSACVVDVGDQKTSICCVEDGISHRHTRLTMEYGGCDVSRTFSELLQRVGFSPRSVNLCHNTDAMLFQELKENLCHLDHNRYGYLEESIQIRQPNQYIVKYGVRMGDELVLAPLSLFFPDMYGMTGSGRTRVQQRCEGDPADPHDDFYLRQVQRGQDPSKLSKKKDDKDTTRDGPDFNMDDSTMNPLQDEDSNDMPENLPLTDPTKLGRRQDLEEEEEEEGAEPLPELMGIDKAILYSIDRCGSDETKKKMYSTILVVGGGMNFEGAQPWLQYRIWMGMAHQYRLMLETMDVITKPKDMDPQIVCWKGATVLACLDTTQELWIKQKEWKQFDVRLLRERAPFVW